MLIGMTFFLAGIFFYFQKDFLGHYWFLIAGPLVIYGLYLCGMRVVSIIKGNAGIYLTEQSLVLQLATGKLDFNWNDIRSFRFTDLAGKRCIGIELFDPSVFLSGQKGVVKAMAEASMKRNGLAFKIPVYAYRVTPDKLLVELSHRLERNRFHFQKRD
ncbi:MAG TPA: STM3941 family protein [Chitinophagaceae bacterium]|nr:STM3941 family protein [Chitinophagaceae bacterium]